MVKIVVENFSEEALIKLYFDLDNKEDWDNDCELCSMPQLLHMNIYKYMLLSDTGDKEILGTCNRMSVSEQNEAWSLFSKKMRPIRRWYTDNMEKNSNFLQGLKEHEQEDHEWKCDLCQKQYGCIKELKEHEKEYHEWKCDRCKKQ